jgi:hypothetical protein
MHGRAAPPVVAFGFTSTVMNRKQTSQSPRCVGDSSHSPAHATRSSAHCTGHMDIRRAPLTHHRARALSQTCCVYLTASSTRWWSVVVTVARAVTCRSWTRGARSSTCAWRPFRRRGASKRAGKGHVSFRHMYNHMDFCVGSSNGHDSTTSTCPHAVTMYTALRFSIHRHCAARVPSLSPMLTRTCAQANAFSHARKRSAAHAC